MPKPILADTDVMVDFLRGRPEAVAWVRTHADRIVLSCVTVAELFAGVRGDTEMVVLNDLISIFRVAPLTTAIAKMAGRYRNDYAKSHGLGLADTMIAATTLSEGAELATLNIRHFPMIAGLKPPYTKP